MTSSLPRTRSTTELRGRSRTVISHSARRPASDERRDFWPGGPLSPSSKRARVHAAGGTVGNVAGPNKVPTGTVTFLFSDIEGSTARWERAPVAMQEALQRHDRLVRAAIVDNEGHVFKTIGDAFCAAFPRAEAGVAAAVAVERSLAAEDFTAVDGVRVRIALHSGTADERDHDYFGPVVNRVARLLSVAHGGQIILSGITADLAQGNMPAGLEFRDLGEHRLKDLTNPERVFQAVGLGLADDFPPLRSLGSLPNNLPVALTSFVGRDHEVGEIVELIARSRLVTLVGAGGVGKTRVALQAAANVLDRFPDGAWLVELAPLSDPALIPGAVAAALGVALPQEGHAVANLVAVLKPKTALVILDNCEHVIHDVAQGIATVLRDCANVTIVATSRERIGVNGEQAYRMPTLRFPKAHDLAMLDAERALEYGAIALFVDRATSSDNRFSLTDDNASVVGEIVRRLDGIALAIELAAPRVKMLSLPQLRQKLDERFRLLTGGSREALPRQKTLRALIDWSYDLLDARERALFRRTGIFLDGFSLEAAGAVASDESFDEFEVLDALSSLVDKSLVTAEVEGESTRYSLLESTRAYALEKLAEAGESAALAERHARYFANLVREADRERESSGTEESLMALAPELENLRAAFAWSLERDPVESAAIASVAIGTLWERIGLRAEWTRRLKSVLERLPADGHHERAKAFATMTYLYGVGNDYAREYETGEAAVAHAREANDPRLLAQSLIFFAQAATFLRRYDEAERALDEAEPSSSGDPRARVRLLTTRAHVASARGDVDAAVSIGEEQLATARVMKNLPAEALAIVNLAESEHSRGNTMRAAELLRGMFAGEASAALGRERQALALGNLTAYLAALDDGAAALETALAALAAIDQEHREDVSVAVLLEHAALALALVGRTETAAVVAGYSAATYAGANIEREFTELTTSERLGRLLNERLSAEERSGLSARGAALTAAQTIAELRASLATNA